MWYPGSSYVRAVFRLIFICLILIIFIFMCWVFYNTFFLFSLCLFFIIYLVVDHCLFILLIVDQSMYSSISLHIVLNRVILLFLRYICFSTFILYFNLQRNLYMHGWCLFKCSVYICHLASMRHAFNFSWGSLSLIVPIRATYLLILMLLLVMLFHQLWKLDQNGKTELQS